MVRPSIKFPRLPPSKKYAASILEEVEDFLKALRTTVVGIGDFGFRMGFAKFAEEDKPRGGIVAALPNGEEILVVAAIHREDPVELSEVGRLYLPRPTFGGYVAIP